MSGPRRWVWDFAERPPGDSVALTALLGGKGFALQRMVLAGYDVPPGFVVTTAACRRYFEAERSLPEPIWQQILEGVSRLEDETGHRFGQGPRPLLLAVRSGAPVSMPGMLDTLLNCGWNSRLAADFERPHEAWQAYAQFVAALAASQHHLQLASACGAQQTSSPAARCEQFRRQYQNLVGEPLPDDPWELLSRSIRAVFDSWQSPRARHYRRLHGLDDSSATAVIVQAMFAADSAGVLFTSDPLQVDPSRMVIEAVRGLGTELLSGRATPQRFVVRRGDLELLPPKDPAGTPILNARQLRSLCALGLRLEEDFGGPVDVEWGCAAETIALLQARRADPPAAAARGTAIVRQEIDRLRSLTSSQRKVWVRHNLDGILPAPTPLTWSVVRQFMSGRGGFGRLYRELGYRPSSRVSAEGFLELIAGRIYADPERLAELFSAGLPLRYDLAKVAADPGQLDRAPDRFEPQATDGSLLFRLPGLAWTMARAGRRVKRLAATAGRRFRSLVLPEFLAYVERERRHELRDLDDPGLLELLEQRRRRVLDQFAPESLKLGLFAGLAYAALERQLVQLMGADEGRRLARTLVTGLETEPETDQDEALYRLARGELVRQTFLDRFGHRAAHEMELATPRWREDREAVEQLCDWLRSAAAADPRRLRAEAAGRRSEATLRLAQQVADQGGSCLLPGIERELDLARRLLPHREVGKHYLMMGYELLRQVIEQLAARWQLGGDIYFLTLDELPKYKVAPKDLRTKATARRTRWLCLQRFPLPDVIDSGRLDDLELKREREGEGEREGVPPGSTTGIHLTGTPLSGGRARGPMAVVTDLRSPRPRRTGFVLVCTAIDPGLAPLLAGACGLVVAHGGVLSHGAVLARQLGIPAVACPDITRSLPLAATIVVDGDRGQVLLERAP